MPSRPHSQVTKPPAIHHDDPQPGHYKMRLVSGGPWLPVIIWWHKADRDEAGDLMEDEGLECEIDGKRVDPYARWVSVARHPIGKLEFKRLSALRQWAADHAPDDPYAAPDQPVDLNKAAPNFLMGRFHLIGRSMKVIVIYRQGNPGLTKREAGAIAAMQGILAASGGPEANYFADEHSIRFVRASQAADDTRGRPVRRIGEGGRR